MLYPRSPHFVRFITVCEYREISFALERHSLLLAGLSHLTLFSLGWGGGRGGDGGGQCPRRFQLSRTSVIFKQYLPNVVTFTKIFNSYDVITM